MSQLLRAASEDANFLEIKVLNPETHGVGTKMYTDYEVQLKVKLAALLGYNQFLIVLF